MAKSIPDLDQVQLPWPLRPRRLPIIVRAIVLAALVPASLLLAPTWRGVFCASVFAVFALVYVAMLFPSFLQVVITEEGIEIARLCGGPLSVAWRDIAGFHVRKAVYVLYLPVSVGWHYASHADAPAFGDFPPLFYGRRDTDALVSTLNNLRQRYG